MAERLKIEYNEEYDWIEDPPSYRDIVETFGKVLIEEEVGDYQGDSLYLIRDGYRYGVLTFGWGSCSGCDALQDCRNQEDIDRLQDDLERGIRWFDDLDEVKDFLASGGLKDSYLSYDLVLNFGAKIMEYDKENN